MVGVDLARQMRVLQDELPPFPKAQALQILREDLSVPVDKVLSEFVNLSPGRSRRCTARAWPRLGRKSLSKCCGPGS